MIDSQFLQSALLDIGKSFAGITISQAVDLPNKVDLGDSFVGRNVSKGAISFLASDVIDGLLTQGQLSKLYNMNIIGALDDTLFYSAISAGVQASNVDVMLYNSMTNQFRLSRDQAEILAQSCLLSGARVSARYVDTLNDVPMWVKNIRYPIRTLTQ